MNYIYYNEFGKEVKKYLSPIAKGSSGIKIYIFSDFDNSSETEYEVSASFKKADGFVAGDIFLPLSSNTKTNPYNQQAMYYRELTIGNDVTDIVGGLQLSIRYIQTNVIVVDSDAVPPVTYEEEVIHVTGMVTFNIYDATSFISPPQNTALINLKNYLLNYIDTQDINIFAVDRTFLQSLGVTNNLTVGNTLEVGDHATFNQDVTVGVDLTVYGRIFAEGGLDSRAKKIINVAPPENPLDAVNKSYVDTILITKENLINKITAWGEAPTNEQYASAKLIKDYLDNNIFTKTEINALYEKVANKVTTFNNPTDTQYPSAKLVKDYVDTKASTVYKPQGSLAFNDLVVGLLKESNSGFVYNITEAFTTNENFVEGAGKSHSAGTNVVIIEHSGNYKFDVLGGTVDLTPYELLSNKVIAWSSTTNDTKYPSEKLVKDSLDAINVGLENIGDLSPLRFAGYFTGGTVSNDFNNLIRPFENLTEALPDFYINNVKGAMFVCSAASDFVFNTVYFWSTEEGTGKTTPITFNWAAPYDQGIGTTNFEVGDTISILNFAYDTVENEMFILIKVEKNLEENFVVKNESITSATKPKITYDAKGLVTAGADLTAEDIPALSQSKITDLVTDLGNKQATLTFDSSPTSGSTNPVTSGGVYTALNGKVDKVADKGLSTEDYTTNEKNKLAGLTAEITVETWNTATKTLALSDSNKLFKCSHTTDQTLTIPTNTTVAFPIGTMITFLLTSTYTVTFSGASGVTLTSMDSLVELATQFGMASLIKTDTDTWQLVGALE